MIVFGEYKYAEANIEVVRTVEPNYYNRNKKDLSITDYAKGLLPA